MPFVRSRFAVLVLGTISATAALATGSPIRAYDGVPTVLDTTCFTDTSQADFQSDIASVNCDVTAAPGSVVLSAGPGIDQQNTTGVSPTNGFGITTTAWGGQSFTAGVSGNLYQADLQLFCSGCSGADPNLTVSIRAVNVANGQPTGADLATATLPGFSSSARIFYSVTFGAPVSLVAGNKYAVIIRPVANRTGAYAYACTCVDPADTNPYAGGARVTSGNSGGAWSVDNNNGGRDLGFKIYVSTAYLGSGTFTSSLKDGGAGARWGNIDWTATVPAGTGVTFQVAASDNPAGPFSFVGPDGTAATTYADGGPLSQFNGKRYLRYRAQLTSTGAATPSLHDVQICLGSGYSPLVDLDGDGTGDVFTYHAGSGDWKRAIAQGDGTFAESNGVWDPAWIVTPARFDNDELTDLFLFNVTSGQWFRMLNDGASGFTTQASGAWWNGWQRFVMDLNGDGLSDVFLYDPASGVWFKANLTASPDFEYFQGGWNPNWEVTPMRLNDDAIDDMYLIDRTTGRWFLMHGQAGAGMTVGATDVWYAGWNLHPGDFNGDDTTDLLLHDPESGTYFVAMNNGLGTGFTYSSGGWSLGWTPYVGDLDADGDEDLFLHGPDSGVWFQMVSDGAGGFAAGGSGAWSLGWSVHLTDLNGDGRTDIFLYHPEAGVWYQARNLSLGTFSYSSGTWSPNLTIIVRSPFF